MENKSNILVAQFQQIELPNFTERLVNASKWVRYGENNDFPYLLQGFANRSALHNAIVTSKVEYAYADGLVFDGETVSEKLFYDHPNPYETLNDIYKKCLFDYVLYGGFALNVIWDKKQENISSVYHCDFSKLRSGKKNEKGYVDNYYYNSDWLLYATKTVKEIPAYNVCDKNGGQIMYVKEYRPGQEYYPLPQYVGALNYIAIDAEISNFHLAHIENGMAPNYLLSFNNGVPSPDERESIKRSFIKEFTGTDNAGKFVLSFSDSAENAPTITNLSSDNLDEQFIQLQATVLQNILSGHGVVSPMLVGIKTEGQLGGASELNNAYNIYYQHVIRGIQDIVVKHLNEVLSHTMNYNGVNLIPTRRTIEFE